MKNKVQLITYPDSFGGNLTRLNQLLLDYFQDIFEGGVHILPPFKSTGDRGFAPMTYFDIEPTFGSWQDVSEIANNFDVMLDVMVNHISRQSTYFQDFLQKGRESQYADMFITLDKIWCDGKPPQDDVAKIFLRKPEHPFLNVHIQETGETDRVWATFGREVNHAEQIDLDVNSSTTKRFLSDLMNYMSKQGVKNVRLDAVGYVIKKPGTTCFMVEPDVYEFIDWLTEKADKVKLELLPEIHDHYSTTQKLAKRGYWVYDFVLPMMILHTLVNQSSQKLEDYLRVCPCKQVTMLDCHDGIPVQPDLDDILTIPESKHIVQLCLDRGANLNRVISDHLRESDFDAHQINITYYDALGRNDDAYLAARAIQFFAPGVPQVYYVGLLAGQSDQERFLQTGEGREINRHNYSVDEIEAALEQKVVQRLLMLIRFRNTHPAFNGGMKIVDSAATQVAVEWRKGAEYSRLLVDLVSFKTEISYSNRDGKSETYIV